MRRRDDKIGRTSHVVCRVTGQSGQQSYRRSGIGFSCDLRRTTCDGFTLVELLVVIAIITMLAGLVVGAAQSARRRAAVTKAKAVVAGLETAIEMYESDVGAWPSSGNETLVTALEGPSDAAGWEGPYMRFKESDLEEGALIDPWGEPYRYETPGDAAHDHEQYFDLSSAGPDGEFGNADDVTNW